MQTIDELCTKIDLQEEMTKKVKKFCGNFDFSYVGSLLEMMQQETSREAGRLALKEQLGEDTDGVKILSCMLYCAIDCFRQYQAKGIDEKIFIDTMKCFSRFIQETYEQTGQYCFDRDFWTTRQIGLHLFRIGELEYEFTTRNDEHVISIHIPSDTGITDEICNRSLKKAQSFIKQYYPQYSQCHFICISWLLSPNLKNVLSEQSNIIKFQNRFQIVSVKEEDQEFMKWVFQTDETDLEKLPEATSLQKNLKQYLKEGGKIGEGIGVLLPSGFKPIQ